MHKCFHSNLCVSSSFWLSVQCFADINGIEPEIVVPTGPFRNVGLSKAAQTHKLRKLRSPSKCRECDSYVYFQGAECEEVSHVCCAWTSCLKLTRLIKAIVHPKTKILSLITPPSCCSKPIRPSEHKLRYFWFIQRALWPFHRQQGSLHDQGSET